MGEQHKDFLALTHGEEWVNFYESFDKLVQDNLARSSDLLKRAMTLPEVADREVAKIKTEHETQLADERNRQRAVLSDLRNEITTSHQQVSALSKGMTAVLADLERLSGRITTALASVEAVASVQASPAAAAAPDVPAAPAAVAEAAPVEAVATPEEPAPAAPVAEMEAPVDADAPAGEPAAIDLTALAEAEVETAPESAPAAPAETELVGAANGTAERQRPHWLSVTRLGSSGNN